MDMTLHRIQLLAGGLNDSSLKTVEAPPAEANL